MFVLVLSGIIGEMRERRIFSLRVLFYITFLTLTEILAIYWHEEIYSKGDKMVPFLSLRTGERPIRNGNFLTLNCSTSQEIAE